MLFLFIIVLGVVIRISGDSWIVVWLGLEINLLSFIPVVLIRTSKFRGERMLKYFLIQRISSSVILINFVFIRGLRRFSIIVIVCLILKIGAAPVHQWVPRIIEGLRWVRVFLLIRIQKIPIIVLLGRVGGLAGNKFIEVFVYCSGIVGILGGIIQRSLRKILTYSSISHISWGIRGLLIRRIVWVVYFGIYIFILISVIIVFRKMELSNLSCIVCKIKGVAKIGLAMSLISLGGLPPFRGFVPKLIVVSRLLDNGYGTLSRLLLIRSFFSLFIYTRLFIQIFFRSDSIMVIKVWGFSTSNRVVLLNVFGLFGLRFIYFLLNLKLYKL